MAGDQREIVVQAGVDRPHPARLVAGAVVAVEQRDQIRDGTVKVATDGTEQVGRAGERRKIPDVSSDAACDVRLGSPGKTVDAVHPADHADVSQQIALEIAEGIPVAQDLRAVGATPHEIGGLELLARATRRWILAGEKPTCGDSRCR